MKRGKLYVIVQNYDDIKSCAFYFLHEDKRDISPEFTSLENAQKFNQEEINFIKKNFSFLFTKRNVKVKEVIFSLAG